MDPLRFSPSLPQVSAAPPAAPASAPPVTDSVTLSGKADRPLPLMPRTVHAGLSDADKAVQFVDRFNDRLGLSPRLLGEKIDLMKSSPLTFFRATPSLFFEDVLGTWASQSKLLDRDAPRITIDGDMHLGNFGTLRTPDGGTAWGANDQDQAGTGSPEHDLERLATGVVLVGRQNGLGRGEQKRLVALLAEKYCDTLERRAQGDEKGPAHLTRDEARGAVKELIDDAASVSQRHLLDKTTEKTQEGGLRFLRNASLKPLGAERKSAVEGALREYEKSLGPTPDVARPLEILDICERLGSGGSSYGLGRYWALVEGKRGDGEPLILELKQLLPPAVEDRSGDLRKADGAKMVEHQRKLGGFENSLTGSTHLDGMAYLVREREAAKDSLDIKELTDASGLEKVVKQAAHVLGRAHGQTAGQARAIDSWIGDGEKRLAENLEKFAFAYADRTQSCFEAFEKKHA